MVARVALVNLGRASFFFFLSGLGGEEPACSDSLFSARLASVVLILVELVDVEAAGRF